MNLINLIAILVVSNQMFALLKGTESDLKLIGKIIGSENCATEMDIACKNSVQPLETRHLKSSFFSFFPGLSKLVNVTAISNLISAFTSFGGLNNLF